MYPEVYPRRYGEELQLAVRSDNETIEVELGPLLVVGTATEWKAVLERERADALPLPEAPVVPPPPAWEGERRRFPVASSE